MTTIFPTAPHEVLEVGYDWLTATVKSEQKQKVILSRVTKWQEQRSEEGFEVIPYRSRFYKGLSCGGVTYGERDDDAMFALSGVPARRWAGTLATWADTISRCDIQVTLRDPNIGRDWARHCNSLANELPEVISHHLYAKLIVDSLGGATSYIGKGSSDRMIRVYNKHIESDGAYPLGSWRWEVQYRHRRAQKVALQLLQGGSIPTNTLALVCSVLATYGIALPTECLPLGWKDAGVKHEADDEGRLRWLRANVAPCVERLREVMNTSTVMKALGLDDVVDTLNATSSWYAIVDEAIGDGRLAESHQRENEEVPF